MAAPLNTCTTIEQCGVVRFFVGKKYGWSKGYPQKMQPIWAAFLCGYPLLPYFLLTKNAQRHTVLSWYMYSGAPPSCNSCYICTVMRMPIVVRHNKTIVHMGSISMWTSFAFIFFAHKRCTTPHCSIVVHVFRGATIL
jgi:hypothetical protein